MKKEFKKSIKVYTLFQWKSIAIEFAFPLLSIGAVGFHRGNVFCFIGPFVIWLGRKKQEIEND